MGAVKAQLHGLYQGYLQKHGQELPPGVEILQDSCITKVHRSSQKLRMRKSLPSLQLVVPQAVLWLFQVTRLV